MTTNEQTIMTLNGLIETCRDGVEGFVMASEGVKDAGLKTLFKQYSEQRAKFARDLEAEVSRLGGEAETKGSVSGALHRGWMNIKSAVAGKDDDMIISECERGEDVAKRAYQKAISGFLPPTLLPKVQSQYTQVLQAHDRIRALEKAAQGA
jgi:uncharacterized protein (TIGR02284 family)